MKNLTLEQFTKDTASEAPVPGGGSIAALCGSLSASLSAMVANLTIGKKKYAEVEDEMKHIAKKAEETREKMLDYIEEDCKAFNFFMESLKLPKDTDEEKDYRKKAMQEGLKKAAMVPYEIAETAYGIMELAEATVKKGNSHAVTDGLISAMTARTAVLSALLNVKINLDSIEDAEYVKKMRKKVEELEAKAVEEEKKILSLSSF
jgi:formiminotetrahydrofolate cyclodeaminase